MSPLPAALRVGVVSTGEGQGSSELGLVVRRVCAALAGSADVTVLATGPAPLPPVDDGAVRVVTFAGSRPDPRARAAAHSTFFGPEPGAAGVPDCGCTAEMRRILAADLPYAAQQVLLRSGGGESADLLAHLAAAPYDVVVFAGCSTVSTHRGVDALRGRCRTALLAGAVDEPAFWMPAVGELLDAVDTVLTAGEYETALVARRSRHRARPRTGTPARPSPPGRAAPRHVGLVLRVAELSTRTPPYGYDGRPTFGVVADWNEPRRHHRRAVTWGTRLHHDLAGRGVVRFVGPGTQRLAPWGRAPFSNSRVDIWRWMHRSTAIIDPDPAPLVGRVALESLMYGTPVIVPAASGASRHHAEAGDGGLWYRSYDEMRACAQAMLEPEAAAVLGSQGRAYAEAAYGDTEAFVRRVRAAVLGGPGEA